VVRLGLVGALRRTLATTNPIESAPSVTSRVTARVTLWRGDAAAVVRGGLAARREPVPPAQGAQGPPDAHQGPGGVQPSKTIWYRARRRVRLALFSAAQGRPLSGWRGDQGLSP
jgi:hypothetical protein